MEWESQRWIGIAKRDVKSYRHVICEFCGAETLTGETPAFCSNCESVVGSEIKSMQGANPELLSQIESLRTAVLKKDFEAAATIYDQLIKGPPEPAADLRKRLDAHRAFELRRLAGGLQR